MSKRCCGCNEVQPLSAFYKASGRPDGHQSVCKSCTKANNRKWRDDNPGAHIRHYANREFTDAEREDRKRRAREWLDANPERARENGKRWNAKNPEKCKAMSQKRTANRRARKIGAFVEAVEPLVVLERDDGACGICGGDVDPMNFHVDHIVPLARGGEHSYANTQPAHPSCNLRKWATVDFDLRAAA